MKYLKQEKERENKMFEKNKIIFIDNEIKSKTELFELISKKTVDLGISDDYEKILKGFEEREALGSTGFQDGFGIPHCKSEAVKQASALFIRAKKPIEWDTFDDSPLENMFALLIPLDNNENHLKMLTTISRKLMNEEFRNSIKAAKTEDEILKLLEEIN